MKPDSDPPLPRSPEDPEHLRQLRRDAMRRLMREEDAFGEREPAPVYGGPVTIYGGPPPSEPPEEPGHSPWRRLAIMGLILALIGIVGAVAAAIFGRFWGKPEPEPGRGPAAVYGGPVPQPSPPEPVLPKDKVVPPKGRPAKPHPAKPRSSSPAAVYGGPVPPAPPPSQ